MTKKDFSSQENIDREQDHGREDPRSHADRQPKSTGNLTYVKNANATGDGAFGHTETGVPEEEEGGEDQSGDPVY